MQDLQLQWGCGFSSPSGFNPSPSDWEQGVLATGLPGSPHPQLLPASQGALSSNECLPQSTQSYPFIIAALGLPGQKYTFGRIGSGILRRDSNLKKIRAKSRGFEIPTPPGSRGGAWTQGTAYVLEMSHTVEKDTAREGATKVWGPGGHVLLWSESSNK